MTFNYIPGAYDPLDHALSETVSSLDFCENVFSWILHILKSCFPLSLAVLFSSHKDKSPITSPFGFMYLLSCYPLSCLQLQTHAPITLKPTSYLPSGSNRPFSCLLLISLWVPTSTRSSSCLKQDPLPPLQVCSFISANRAIILLVNQTQNQWCLASFFPFSYPVSHLVLSFISIFHIPFHLYLHYHHLGLYSFCLDPCYSKYDPQLAASLSPWSILESWSSDLTLDSLNQIPRSCVCSLKFE